MSKRRAWQEKTKTSKSENLKKHPQITYKFFSYFLQPGQPICQNDPYGRIT
jgi:hypothetical protein